VATVPKGVVATTQHGPDFEVHRLIRLGPLGAAPDSVGLYLGHHPDFTPGPRKAGGMLFGKAVAWQVPAEGKGLEALAEKVIPGDIPTSAHVWITAEDDVQLATLKGVAESLKIVSKP
jgi:hypothetical protein